MSSSGEPSVSRRNYLKYAGAGVVIVAAAAAGGYYATKPGMKTATETATATVPKRYKWGFEPYHYIDDDWYRVAIIGAQFYAEDRGYDLVVQNPSANIEAQIDDIKNMVTEDKIDGLIVTPADQVVIIDTLKWVKEQGVPIVTTQYDVETDAVDLSIIVDYTLIGTRMGEEMINAAKRDGVKLKGNVFIVTGPLTDYQSKTLTEAERAFLEGNYPDLKPIVLECPTSGTGEAIKNVVDGYHGYGKPFGIFGNNMATSIGCVEGMKNANIAMPGGKMGHVYTSTFDGAQQMWDHMEAGLVDCLVDAPNPHIESMAQDFLAVIKEKGIEGLPPVGATVISDMTKPEGPQAYGTWNILLHGKEHKGINPWLVSPWAPAKVTSHMNMHKIVNVSASMITPDKLPDYKNVSWVRMASAWLS